MNIILSVLGLMFAHWIGDFVLQTDKQAKNKSKSNYQLGLHVISYSSTMFMAATLLLPSKEAAVFFGITLAAHFITDYITSRINSKLYEANKIHNFFVSIGFDQWLHTVQILLTYGWLANLL